MGLLKGVRIVDTTRLLPGGYCTMILAEMGAEVIKVEQPGIGDYMRATPPTISGRSPLNESMNRNKSSVGIDLKKDKGREVMRRLLRTADVFVEGFRPGVMKRLGFSFEHVARHSPKIIYCSISAYGQDSPLSIMPGHDINFESMAGALYHKRAPSFPALQAGDMVSGAFASISILGALAGGRRPLLIDVPIVQSLMSWMLVPISMYLAGEVAEGADNLLMGETPYYNFYRTSDGKYISVAAIEERFWHNLVVALGVPEIESLRFGTREERAKASVVLKRVFAAKSRDHWANALMDRDTCATPVLSPLEALESPWAIDSVLKESPTGKVAGWPVRMGPSARVSQKPAPDLGSDTDRILRGLGYTAADIRGMKSTGAIQ